MNNEYVLSLPNFIDAAYARQIGLGIITDDRLASDDTHALKVYTDIVTIDVESDT